MYKLFNFINSLLKKFKEVDGTHGPVMSKLVILSFPLVLTMIITNLYEVVDNYWLGHYSSKAMASSQVSRMFTWFITSLAFGVGLGGSTLISQHKGAKNDTSVKYFAGQTLIVLIFISVIIMISSFFLPEILLRLVDTPSYLIENARKYIFIHFLSAPIIYLEIGIAIILNGTGNTILPFLFSLTAVIINSVLDPLLIFGKGPFPELGVTGAAYATLISRVIVVSFAIFYILKLSKSIELKRSHFYPSFDKIKKILAIGIPGSIGSWGSSIGFVVLLSLVTKASHKFYNGSEVLINAYGISNTIIGMYFLVTGGISRGLSLMVGQNIGAQKVYRAEKAIFCALGIAGFFLIIGSTIMYYKGGMLSYFFLPSTIENSNLTQSIVSDILRITSHGVITYGLLNVILGAFEGAGHTIPTMWINLSRLWLLRIPLAYYLTFYIMSKSDGLWWGMAFSNDIVAVVGVILLVKGNWKKGIDNKNVLKQC